MAFYDETAIGGVKIVGCAIITYIKYYQTKFDVGDIVYNVDKAKRGVIEKVVIKKARSINATKTYGNFEVIYVDTFNALWNEWDLVSHREALILSQEYYEDMMISAAQLRKC